MSDRTLLAAESGSATEVAPGLGSESVSAGVRVRVMPTFEPDHSDPFERRYIFSYSIRVTNESETTIRLLSRVWVIINAHGDRHDVEGEGVVGRQPTLRPGESFEYQSYCPLTTAWGTMEGRYQFERPGTGERFEAEVARFYLVTPDEE